MRTLTISILFSLNLICFGQNDKWIEFELLFNNYLTNPTHEKFIKVYNSLPDKRMSGENPKNEILDSILLTSMQLEPMILRGDQDALELGFKLMTIADGEFAEWLDWTIGKLIVTHPALFLEELNNHRQITGDIYGLIVNFGPDFVENKNGFLIEINKRIKSLKNINDPKLNKVRDECLKELHQFEVEVKNWPEEK
jgi:hypothetical protein